MKRIFLKVTIIVLCLINSLGYSTKVLADDRVIDKSDGEYTVEVKLEGGSGKAKLTSPTALVVKDGCATARIEWSSSNYDYMVLDGEKYLPVSMEGGSVFELPVPEFDKAFTVVADTTAMSKPHEIEYSLTFFSDTITPVKSGKSNVKYIIWVIVFVVVFIIAVAVMMFFKLHRKNRN